MKQITDNPELYQQLVELYGKERADKMIADRQQKSQAIKDSGVAYKSQRPAPSIADLQQKQKALRAKVQSFKDAQDAAEAEAVLDLNQLAESLELDIDAVMQLVRQYSLPEVSSILRTLSGQKTAGKSFMSQFYGVKMKNPQLDDIAISLKQSSKSSDHFWK